MNTYAIKFKTIEFFQNLIYSEFLNVILIFNIVDSNFIIKI